MSRKTRITLQDDDCALIIHGDGSVEMLLPEIAPDKETPTPMLATVEACCQLADIEHMAALLWLRMNEKPEGEALQ